MAGSVLRRLFTHAAVRCVILAAAYTGAGTLGLRLAFANENVTTVWPPTGIAVAALLVWGWRVWPGIVAGALTVNLLNGASAITASGISLGNTLAPLAAVALLRRVGFRTVMDRLRDVAALFGGAGFLAMTISATGGLLTLRATTSLPADQVPHNWLTWWVGDAMGVALVTPLLLALVSREAVAVVRRRPLEALGVFVVTAASAPALFTSRLLLRPLAFPLIAWAAVRYEAAGGAVITAIAAAGAIGAYVAGGTPSLRLGPTDALISLQVFNLALAVTSAVLAALAQQRRRSMETLARSAQELEERVRERTSQLHEAQRLARIGSWHWDVPTNHVVWSDELYRIYGVTPDTFAASYEGFLERIHLDDQSWVTELIQQHFVSHQPFAFEHRIVRPDGEVRWLEGRGQVVADPATGGTLAMFGTGQDITERKRTEQALRDAYDELQSLDRAKDSFLAAVSHELRTPLTVVLGLSQMLRSGDVLSDPEKLPIVLNRLAANAERLHKLLLDLLDLDRLARGIIEPRRRDVNLRQLVERVVETLDLREHPLRIDVPAMRVAVDPAQVERIVENLVANAVNHTARGTPIVIGGHGLPDGVLLSVQDAGEGVPDHLKQAIFEPFRQGEQPHQSRGTGIGLALVARFAELHGGRAWVEDRPGGGAAFQVFLPREALSA